MLGLRKFPEHFLGLRGFTGIPWIPRNFPGIFRDFPGFPEKIPEIPGIFRNFTGFPRNFSEFSGEYGISVISEIFDSRPAGSRPSSRRKFSNKFRGFLKISWAQKMIAQNTNDSPVKFLRENFHPNLNQLKNFLINFQKNSTGNFWF